MDLAQVNRHLALPSTLASGWSHNVLLDKVLIDMVIVVINVQIQSLLRSEVDVGAGDLAVIVVDVDVALDGLVWQEDVLLKLRVHGGCTLVQAAACLDLADFLLFLTGLECDGWLADDQHLLVLHLIVGQRRAQRRLDGVLDLGLGLLAALLVFVVERRRNAHGKDELEADLRASGVDEAAWHSKDSLLVFKELPVAMNLLMTFDLTVPILFHPVTNPLDFLLAFDFKFNVRSLDGLGYFDEDLSVDGIAGFVEGELSLKLHLASFKDATCVREVKHFKE